MSQNEKVSRYQNPQNILFTKYNINSSEIIRFQFFLFTIFVDDGVCFHWITFVSKTRLSL